MRRFIIWAPLAGFIIFVIVVAIGLYAPAPRTVQSALIGRPVPEFTLAPALPGRAGVSSQSLRRGQPRVVNVFASWCIPCRAEAAQLEVLKQRGVPIDGIAVRDRPQDLQAFLATYGDPFASIGADVDRRVQLNLGSAGVPETFVIDGNGVIRHQHIGAVMPQDIPTLVAAWEAAR